MANVCSEKPCGSKELQTYFDHWFVIVVVRGAAKEGLDYKKLVLRVRPEERRLRVLIPKSGVLSRVPSPQQLTSRHCVDF